MRTCLGRLLTALSLVLIVIGAGLAQAPVTGGTFVYGRGADSVGLDPAVVTELDSITPLALALAGYPRAVLLGATSTLLLQGRLAPRPLAWTGYALALLALAATATVALRALFPLVALQGLLFPLWVLALAGTLLARSRPAGSSAGASVPGRSEATARRRAPATAAGRQRATAASGVSQT